VTEKISDHTKKPMPLIPKGSVPEKVKKESQGGGDQLIRYTWKMTVNNGGDGNVSFTN